MLCIDVIEKITTYLGVNDILSLKQTCKEFSGLKFPNIKNIFASKINQVLKIDDKNNFGKNVVDIISKFKELTLEGSIILQTINEEIFDSNIDIFCDYYYVRNDNFNNEIIFNPKMYDYCNKLKAFSTLNNYLLESGMIRNISSKEYPMKNCVVYDYNFPLSSRKIQIILTPETVTTRIKDLEELTFCNNYFDGSNLYMSHYDNIVKKFGYLELSNKLSNHLDSDFLNSQVPMTLRRIIKYCNRNFDIYIAKQYFTNAIDDNLVNKTNRGLEIHFITHDRCYDTGRVIGTSCEYILLDEDELPNHMIFNNEKHVCKNNHGSHRYKPIYEINILTQKTKISL